MGVTDTSRSVAEMQEEVFRRMTGAQRLRAAFELSDFLRSAALSRIRAEHPQWTEREVKRELLRIALLPDPLPAGLE